MNRIERIIRIKELIKQVGGTLKTRKKLHKLIYLLQELGEDFDQDYYYYNYGVFSQSLASDLDFADDNKDIIEEKVEEVYSYQIGETRYPDEDKLAFKGENLVKITSLGEKSPRLLEVLSTIVYLNRNHYSGEELKNKLLELKPDHDDEFKEAYVLAKDMFKIEV